MTTTQSNTTSGTESASTVTSTAVPVLGEGFKDRESAITSAGTHASDESGIKQDSMDKDEKLDKRQLWRLAKNKEDKTDIGFTPTSHPTPSSASPLPSEMMGTDPASPKITPTSPTRIQSSPRVASPASSQIFERNVQEDVAVNTASSAIPSHITTENHIPPVLDASSMAITDDQLTPDTVEIVTHAAHQPASVAVTGASGMDASFTLLATTTSLNSGDEPSMFQSQPHLGTSPIVVPVPLSQSVLGTIRASASLNSGGDTMTATSDDGASNHGASNYGSLDATDFRRLSFISFADVVHAEQVAGADQTSMRDSLVVSPVPATSVVTSPALGAARPPSPARSPASPSLSNSSVTGSASPRFAGLEGSPPVPSRLATGSPQVGLGVSPSVASGSPPIASGELTIETMRQALRKTGSGDLSGARTHFGMSDDVEQEKGR